MSGERQDGRDRIAQTTEHLIRSGFTPKKAQEVAREARIRNEQKDKG